MLELPDDLLKQAAAKAKEVSKHSYSKYSHFPVGAVAIADDLSMYEGCNIENASFGLTICAERTAVFQMVANAKRKLVGMVIYTPTPKPFFSCGACRQVMCEFADNCRIVSVCDSDETVVTSLGEILPFAFTQLE